MVLISSIVDPTINIIEKKGTERPKQISPELKNDYSKVLQKFDEYSGNGNFNQNIPIDSPAGLQFPTKIKTDLGDRLEQLTETGNISRGMMPSASKKSNSMSFPDVCRVPAPPAPFVPIPFPNIELASKELTKILIGLNIDSKDISQAAELTAQTMLKMMEESSGRMEGNANEIKSILHSGPQIFQLTLENIIGKGGIISNEDKKLITAETAKFEKNLITKVQSTLGISEAQMPQEITATAAFKAVLEIMSEVEQKAKPKAEKALGKDVVNAGYQGAEITGVLVTKGPAAAWSMIRNATSDTRLELLTALTKELDILDKKATSMGLNPSDEFKKAKEFFETMKNIG